MAYYGQNEGKIDLEAITSNEPANILLFENREIIDEKYLGDDVILQQPQVTKSTLGAQQATFSTTRFKSFDVHLRKIRFSPIEYSIMYSQNYRASSTAKQIAAQEGYDAITQEFDAQAFYDEDTGLCNIQDNYIYRDSIKVNESDTFENVESQLWVAYGQLCDQMVKTNGRSGYQLSDGGSVTGVIFYILGNKLCNLLNKRHSMSNAILSENLKQDMNNTGLSASNVNFRVLNDTLLNIYKERFNKKAETKNQIIAISQKQARLEIAELPNIPAGEMGDFNLPAQETTNLKFKYGNTLPLALKAGAISAIDIDFQ